LSAVAAADVLTTPESWSIAAIVNIDTFIIVAEILYNIYELFNSKLCN
jgi:hypothetical protein